MFSYLYINIGLRGAIFTSSWETEEAKWKICKILLDGKLHSQMYDTASSSKVSIWCTCFNTRNVFLVKCKFSRLDPLVHSFSFIPRLNHGIFLASVSVWNFTVTCNYSVQATMFIIALLIPWIKHFQITPTLTILWPWCLGPLWRPWHSVLQTNVVLCYTYEHTGKWCQ